MPVVPIRKEDSRGQGFSPMKQPAPAPSAEDEPWLLMGAAQMDKEGRLIESAPPSGNLGATRRAWENKGQEDRQELRKGLDQWDERSRKFRDEIEERGLMTPELKEIYDKRFGPSKPKSPPEGTPMS